MTDHATVTGARTPVAVPHVSAPASRLPRTLHPGAWWLWALGLATAASHTTNPLPLALLIGTAAFVVVRRRSDAPGRWRSGCTCCSAR